MKRWVPLEGTEKAADDASKSLAAFDEINKLSSANGIVAIATVTKKP